MSAGALESPRRLVRQDVTTGFRSGTAELDDWFQCYAWQNQKTNNAIVYVIVQGDVIFGYYAITTATYSRDDAPQRFNHHSHPGETPYIPLAWLAVDERVQGWGAGTVLFRDMIERCYRPSREVDAVTLTVHYRDEQARASYLTNGDFLPSPVNTLHPLLSMKQLSRMLGSS